LITLENIEFAWAGDGFALNIEKFDIASGEQVAIVGASGSGKTTLLNLIAGVVVPARGQITVGGETVSSLSETERRAFRAKNVGFVFQDFRLLDYLNVLDNIVLPYRISPVLRLDRAVVERAGAIAEQMGIADKLRRRVQALSHGERQRVAICRALVTSPDLILADEATGNLDPKTKHRIIDALLELSTEHDATVVAVTHDHELLPKFGRTVDLASLQAA
jgi:putative ABC transport system ATP-binding protein